MTFAIVRSGDEVLSQETPRSPPRWLSMGVTLATDWRYALTFETYTGATKCAMIYEATVHTIGDSDATERYRTTRGGSVGDCRPYRADSIQRDITPPGAAVRNRPARPVAAGRTGGAGSGGNAGHPATRQPADAAPDAQRVAAGNAEIEPAFYGSPMVGR